MRFSLCLITFITPLRSSSEFSHIEWTLILLFFILGFCFVLFLILQILGQWAGSGGNVACCQSWQTEWDLWNHRAERETTDCTPTSRDLSHKHTTACNHLNVHTHIQKHRHIQIYKTNRDVKKISFNLDACRTENWKAKLLERLCLHRNSIRKALMKWIIIF